MQREEFDRLLAGYATHQLTTAELARLIEASLADQSLFNELADEEALRETLAAPGMKSELLRALAPEARQPFWNWLRKPQVWALAGTAAVAALAFVFVFQPRAVQQKHAEIAQAPAPAAEVAAPKLAPAPAAERVRLEEKLAVKPAASPTRAEPVQLKKAAEPRKEAKAGQEAAPAALAATPPAPASARPMAALRSADAAASTAAKDKAGAAVRSALQYTVLRRNEQGEFVETLPGAVLRKGDAIRLAVTSSSRGYISLTEAGTNSQIHFGFAEPGVKYVIPATGALTLDAAELEKRLRLSFLSGAGNAADQSSGAMSLTEQNFTNQSGAGNLANSQKNAGPTSQSTVEVVVRYR